MKRATPRTTLAELIARIVLGRPVRTFAAVLASLALSFGPNLGCTTLCTFIGCGSGETLRVTLPLSGNPPEPLEFTACRNDVCWHGVLPDLDVDWTIEPSVGVPLEPDVGEEPAGVHGHAGVGREDNGSLSLDMHWQVENYRDVARGDALSVQIRDAQGAELLTVEERVTGYQDDYPNGEECDETPCRSTTIDRTEP